MRCPHLTLGWISVGHPVSAMPSRPLPSALGARFAVRRTLKEQAGVRTLLVVDRRSGAQLVAKVAGRDDVPIGAWLRLQHEAQVLRGLGSPWVAPLVEAGTADDLLYLLTTFVPGVSLAQRLYGGPLAVPDALRVGWCLLSGLEAAHQSGVIHRDVKPSNIVVDEGDPLRQAVLVDFGLARSERLDPSVRELPVGTVRYMAPEQAGLLNVEVVDERADLYAAGAVLYECLTGRPPFPGDVIREVLRQHVTQPPPTFAAVGVQAPRAVEDAVRRLLAKDPADRYQSAAAAAADVAEIMAAVAAGIREPAVVVGLHDRRRTLAPPAFVGRQAELDALARALQAARQGAGDLVLVEAASGGGKTRLLDEAAMRAAQEGAAVFRGQGVAGTAQRPLEVLRGVAEHLVGAVRDAPGEIRRLDTALGERSDAVCAALPELAGVLRPANGTSGPEAFGETRTVEAVEQLLSVIGTADRPALVVLDDAQWADDVTLKVVSRWHQRARGRVHVALVVAFRSEEVGPAHPLRLLPDPPSLRLEPLQPDELRRMAESMAGPLPTPAARAVVELSGGSPFMASAVLRGLVESGGLVSHDDGWRVDPDAMETVTASRHAATVLAGRLALLPAPARALLAVGALLGKEFDLALASAMLNGGHAETAAALEEARRRHLVWVRDSTAVFVHDKIREAVLQQVDAATAASLHRMAATWLEEHDRDRIFALAHHWEAAGASARALPYALAAADTARRQHALAAADEQFAIAERGAGEADPATRRRVAEGRGQVLMLRGRYTEAAERLEAALALADTAVDRARIQGHLGELRFKQGDVQAARGAVEAALRRLGHKVPRTAVGYAAGVALEAVVQILHTALPRLLVGRRRLDQAGDELVAIRLYSRLAHIYWFVAGRVPTLWTHLRGLNLAERYPPTAELAQAYSEHAPVMTMLAWFRRGVAYAERSLAIRTASGDLWGRGQSLHFLGVCLYGASRFAECVERCREAVRLLELTGDRWEVNTARWHIAFARYRQGDLRGAAAEARRVYADGAAIGDSQARGIGLAAWAKASGGQVPRDVLEAELARPADDVHTRAELLQAQAVVLLSEDRPAAAAAVLENAWNLVRDAGLRQEYVVAVLPWLATARRMEAQAVPPWAPDRRRGAVRRARRTARRATRLARAYRNNLPHALRERGLVAALAGHGRRARRWLDRSLAVAEELGMAAEHARSLQARGEVGAARGWDGAAADLDAAARALEPLALPSPRPDQVTPSLVDRFAQVLEAGRTIAAALDPATIYHAVRDAARALLRAERSLIVGVDGEQMTPLTGDGDAPFSRSLVARAAAAGRPVVVGSPAPADVADSLLLSEARSLMCVPIEVRGQVVACLYTDHRQVHGLFAEEEEHLALFLATLAGAALENAEGFAEIQELTRSLEQRVSQRTAQLEASNQRLDQTVTRLRRAYEEQRATAERLERLDQLKNDLLSMVAHDLRSPLAVIHGFATSLQQGRPLTAEEVASCVDGIVRNSKRLAEFTNNLLQFGHIESGQLRCDLEPFDLARLLRRTVAELEGLDNAVTLQVRVPEDLPAALGDEPRQWQVLTNLLSNAVKHSPAGGVVRVTAAREGDHLVVAVQDQGPGVDPADAERMFERFSQLEHRSSGQPAGTGLGLYICRSLVEAQGGRIWVDSRPGGGSTFRYTVRVAQHAGHGRDGDPVAASTQP